MSAHTHSLLASYATFKELYNSKKYDSPYQILAEFIMYVVVTKKLCTFSVARIHKELKEEFGFSQPQAVIQTAMKRLPGIQRLNGEYSVKFDELKANPDFEKYKKAAEAGNTSLMECLLHFAQSTKTDIDIEKEKLSQEFVAFLLDNEGDQEYRKIIGAFIIANESNEKIKQQMLEIREGSILFSGLSYNISEYGSLRNPLRIFLDTEILFDIAGLNGELYRTLALDFLQLVNIANQKDKIVTLSFFSDVKKEIDRFFARAEQIMKGKGELIQRPAMEAIIQGCSDVSDVKDKLADFYYNLQHKYDIKIDEKDDYYTKTDIKYELEAEEIEGFSLDESYEAIRYCSNINKRRKGVLVQDYLKSGYLFVTNTTKVLEISKSLIEKRKPVNMHERYCDYAISLSYITNLLWYKLNRGFGEQKFPHNIDVVVKARVLLSGYITQGISSIYQEIKEKFAAGELSQEAAANRIIALRDKTFLPEEITNENLEKNLSFGNDYLNLLTENNKKNELQIKEQHQIIEELKQKIQEQEEKEAFMEYRRNCRKHKNILWIKMFAYSFIILLLAYVLWRYKQEGLSIATGCISLIVFLIHLKLIIKNDIAEYKNNTRHNKKKRE